MVTGYLLKHDTVHIMTEHIMSIKDATLIDNRINTNRLLIDNRYSGLQS